MFILNDILLILANPLIGNANNHNQITTLRNSTSLVQARLALGPSAEKQTCTLPAENSVCKRKLIAISSYLWLRK